MEKSRQQWLSHLRRYLTQETLEKVIQVNKQQLHGANLEKFMSAADHRLAELIMKQRYDRVPSSVWYHVH